LLILAYRLEKKDKVYLQYRYDFIHYLGGYPLANSSNNKYGTLYISENNLSFRNIHKDEGVFEIPMQQIKNCTIETKESLTSGKIIFLKVFACGLKKNRQYIRIEFKDKLNKLNDVIFYSPTIPPGSIIKLINENRVNLAQNIPFETGKI